jgi:hypothetical protein
MIAQRNQVMLPTRPHSYSNYALRRGSPGQHKLVAIQLLVNDIPRREACIPALASYIGNGRRPEAIL